VRGHFGGNGASESVEPTLRENMRIGDARRRMNLDIGMRGQFRHRRERSRDGRRPR